MNAAEKTKSPVAEFVETRGRKKKAGTRYPSGRLKDEAYAPALIRRLVDESLRGAADPLMATALGKMHLQKLVKTHQLSAGLMYAEIAGRYHSIMGFPLRTPKAPAFEKSYVGHDNNDTPQKVIDKAKKRYQDATQFIAERDSKSAIRRALDTVCIDNLMPEWEQKWFLDKGLTLLAEHFGLLSPQKARPDS